MSLILPPPTEKLVAPHGGMNQTWYEKIAAAFSSTANTATSLDGLGTAARKNIGTSGGTVPLLNTANTFSKAQTFDPVVLEDGPTIEWDWSLGPIARVTLEGDRTLAAPTNLGTKAGTWSVFVKQDGVGTRLLSYDPAYLFQFGVDPTLSTDPDALDILVFTFDGENICGAISKSFA